MPYQILENSNPEEFDRFVQNHASGSFLQSWDWGRWQESLGKKALRLQVVDAQKPEDVLLQCQFLQTHLLGKFYYLYAPYGPMFSPGLKDEAQNEVFAALIDYLNKNFPKAIFFRLEPKQNSIPALNLQLTTYNLQLTSRIQPGKTLILDLNKPADELLAQMHPKTRYNIKLAQKHGVSIQKEFAITPGFGLYLEEIVGLLVETARRQNFKDHGAAYYKRLIEFFSPGQGNVKFGIYKATFHNELLAAALMLDFGNTRTYLFGGSSEANKHLMAPHLLHWQAILDAKAAGLANYDFWGLETSTGQSLGFARFKLGFGGKTLNYPPAFDIVCQKSWYNTYKIIRRLKQII